MTRGAGETVDSDGEIVEDSQTRVQLFCGVEKFIVVIVHLWDRPQGRTIGNDRIRDVPEWGRDGRETDHQKRIHGDLSLQNHEGSEMQHLNAESQTLWGFKL